MKTTHSHDLRVFLCHSSDDKAAVRELYKQLQDIGVEPWLDEENLVPGQEWNYQIQKAVRESDVVIVCLSRGSIAKSGYVQREIKFALDIAEEQPEGSIYIIPAKLEECEIPERIRRFQWTNLFESRGFENLKRSLKIRAESLGVNLSDSELKSSQSPKMDLHDQSQLQSHLYQERLSVFKALRSLINRVRISVKLTFQEVLEFGSIKDENPFLFSEDVKSYLQEIYDKGVALYAIADALQRREPMTGSRRIELVEKQTSLATWFVEQDEVAIKKFAKYLQQE